MVTDPDEERIRAKAHELWEAEGRPHGRDADHWTQAREIIAIKDSEGATLLPRDAGVDEPIENAEESLRNLADFPNLTDQGENLLTSTDREQAGSSEGMPSVEVPTSDQPGIPAKSAGKTAAPKPAAKAAETASPSAAGKSKTASVAKRAQPESVKTGPVAKAPVKKKT